MINNILVNVLESHWRIFGIFGLRQAQDNAGDKEPPNKQGDHGRTLQLTEKTMIFHLVLGFQ